MGLCASAEENQLNREEAAVEGKINYKVDDPRFIEMEKWPVILLDTTCSMNEPTSASNLVTRHETARHCCATLIDMLAPVDTVDEQNVAAAWKGVPVVTFNGVDKGVYRGLFHLQNLWNEWQTIRWHGGTHIMDGWRTMLDTYERQFSDKPKEQRPLLLACIITDGELQDAEEFEKHLKHVHGKVFVEIAVVGYGEDHDRAVRHYQKVTKRHPHVRASPFTSQTDPAMIARQLLSAVDPRLIKQPRTMDQLNPILMPMQQQPMMQQPMQQPIMQQPIMQQPIMQQPPPYNPNASSYA